MSNFNTERLALACASLRLNRVYAEDAFHYATKRETFGAQLIQRQAIQSKIFRFGLMIEPAYVFMEQLVNTIELTKDRPTDDVKIGGKTALLKVMSTRALEKSVREEQQILGTVRYHKAGKGARIEKKAAMLEFMLWEVEVRRLWWDSRYRKRLSHSRRDVGRLRNGRCSNTRAIPCTIQSNHVFAKLELVVHSAKRLPVHDGNTCEPREWYLG
ncbi:Acyl-CoA dehydrogenase, C-terminal domain protein [Aspergillus clavatus NRRL 1]|uniref:Acyl-CoA dehydrogenase, C-terminal domain protein n=1 Tax=Aspergillus clavatus (strain ATCC 1007 / CBS 513.65 / DSM 816 / NCTC 3887 / NRRL 1 / QM 1276 / 107) TaxID=344612 RepID=A1C7Z4_ASPCL|nr:Acyl-CoA dehydrogenase, C-terminal domain protein [Aspergillus clavatus NRRL 1]EAW14515.1 Acyl-CoA dehydrogenase, C-terminal domain protein [Aspergillus clavatus NRRL 1]